MVATQQDAEAAAIALSASGVVGFDTESKPTFAKFEVSSGPHVVQFATRSEAWLFQLHRTELHGVLGELLTSTDLLKAGFGLSSDLSLIRQRAPDIEPCAVLDIDSEFRRRGYRKSIGVKTAVALVFDRRFVKSRKATTSNWANRQLTDAQLRYAANDAYAAMRVFDALGLRRAYGRPGMRAPVRPACSSGSVASTSSARPLRRATWPSMQVVEQTRRKHVRAGARAAARRSASARASSATKTKRNRTSRVRSRSRWSQQAPNRRAPRLRGDEPVPRPASRAIPPGRRPWAGCRRPLANAFRPP